MGKDVSKMRIGEMKILHVINSLSMGGAEKLVADLAPIQRERGHAVEVLLLRGGESAFRAGLESAGIRVYDFGAGTSVYSPLNIFRLIPFMRKYDVIHVHLFPSQYWVAIAKLLSFSKVRLVTTEHSTNNRRRGSLIWKIFDSAVYACYSSVICCADMAKASLCRHLGDWKRICSISNGVDTKSVFEATISSREDFGICEDVFLMGQVARFVLPKDQEAVVRSLPLLPKNIHAVFIGDGERRENCERLAEELGVRERTHFLGIRSDVSGLLKMSNLVICSSAYEGLSLASVEGLASGKPVVASDVPGLAEVVGGAGILFPKGDEKALAEIILKLASDKEFYEKTATACSRRAQDYDIRKTAEAYLAVYENRVI